MSAKSSGVVCRSADVGTKRAKFQKMRATTTRMGPRLAASAARRNLKAIP